MLSARKRFADRPSETREPGRSCAHKHIHLVFVQILVHELVFALFLEGDDDQGHEDVDEKEREHDEVDDVEDCHLHSIARLWTPVLVRCIHGVFEHAATTEFTMRSLVQQRNLTALASNVNFNGLGS